MKCLYCKGNLEENQTNYIADLGDSIIVVRNVPTQVCKQCGEKSYSYEVSNRLQTIIKEVRKLVSGIAEVKYSDVSLRAV